VEFVRALAAGDRSFADFTLCKGLEKVAGGDGADGRKTMAEKEDTG
jgi:hypothetical protein